MAYGSVSGSRLRLRSKKKSEDPHDQGDGENDRLLRAHGAGLGCLTPNHLK